MDITLSVSDDTIANVIFSGLSGGIGHWCSRANIRGRHKGVTSGILSGPRWERYFRPFQRGSLVVRDTETKKNYVIDRAAIAKALAVIGEKYPHHLENILADNTDAETGDVLIQVAAFGDIVRV
jgi:hypothetical protein